MKTWVILLAALAPFWFLQNVIHELAHGLALRLGWGWKFTIWPFPSMRLGRFTFAHVLYEPTAESTTPTNQGWGLVSIMPKIANGAFFILGTLLSTLLVKVSPVAAALCALFAGCNLVDFSVGMAGIFRAEANDSDIWRFQASAGFDIGKLRWLAAGLILVGWIVLAIPAYLLIGV